VSVLGVLPFQPLNIDMEDSQSLQNYRQRLNDVKIRAAVIAYPGLANYNDLDALMADAEVHVELIQSYRPLAEFDMVLLPGSKTVIRDLHWLKAQGLFDEIRRLKKPVFGICGGYQMFCKTLHDPDALEHETAGSETGLGLFDDTVVYKTPKILKRGQYDLFSCPAIKGYEIHCGRMANYPLAHQHEHVAGTHVHGIFDNDDFRTAYLKAINPAYRGYNYEAYREAEIQGFADMVAQQLDIAAILAALQD
jgi:adenosylcobyric acid synthase